MRRKRTPVGLPPAPGRRSRGGLVAVAAIAATAVACLLVALQISRDAGSAPRPTPSPAGLTDRMSFDAATIGSTPTQVRRLLGGAPREIETSPLLRDAPECWVYARRSGREGGYRLCFRGGELESKARIRVEG